MRCTLVASLVAVAVCAVAACSSSRPGAQSASSTPPLSPALTGSSSTPTPTKPHTSTPTPTKPQTSTPTPTKPVSPYEADPAVRALRAWAAQVARTINQGNYDDAALNALMTPSLAKAIKNILGGEIGHRYPGPMPFTPTRVTVTSSTDRDVRMCIVSGGYSLNPKTHKPFAAHRIQAVDAGAVLRGGKWRVSKFATGSFSCAGVKIPEPSW